VVVRSASGNVRPIASTRLNLLPRGIGVSLILRSRGGSRHGLL
jgi:hypothetical protein